MVDFLECFLIYSTTPKFTFRLGRAEVWGLSFVTPHLKFRPKESLDFGQIAKNTIPRTTNHYQLSIVLEKNQQQQQPTTNNYHYNYHSTSTGKRKKTEKPNFPFLFFGWPTPATPRFHRRLRAAIYVLDTHRSLGGDQSGCHLGRSRWQRTLVGLVALVG